MAEDLVRSLLEPDPRFARLLDQAFWECGAPPAEVMEDVGFKRGRRFEFDVHNMTSQWRVRDRFVREFSFALPCKEAIDGIADHSRSIVEIGAGTGFWGSLLAKAGVDIISTDIEPRAAFAVPYEGMDAVTAVTTYPERDVLCVWPSLGEDWATKAALAMQPGRLLFYIGEWNGCTADESFFDLMATEEFEHVDAMSIPQFIAVNDELYIFRKMEPEV